MGKGYFSGLRKSREWHRKRRGNVPLAQSRIRPYAMKYPELVNIAFNQIWDEING